MKLILRNGKYYLLIRRKLYSLHTRDKDIAQRIFCDMITQDIARKVYRAANENTADTNIQIRKDITKIEIAEKFDEYIKTAYTKGISANKIRLKKRVGRMIRDCGVTFFSDFNQESINYFIEKLYALSDDSKKTYITQLRAFMNYSIRKKFMAEDLYKSIEFPNIKCKPRDTIITDEDMTLLLHGSAKDEDFHFYLLTLFNTVCRPNEASSLRVSDIDFEHRKVTVYMNKVCRYKKVYLSGEFCRMLADYIDRHNITEYIFRGVNRREFYAKKFRKLKKKLCIEAPYTLYTVRHTAITKLMNKCHDVEFVARQAGNDPKTTMKHYVNRSDEHYLEILDSIRE